MKASHLVIYHLHAWHDYQETIQLIAENANARDPFSKTSMLPVSAVSPTFTSC